jgi:phosphoglycerol transferase MdoB-like AlkP superfamily enzyme
MNLSFRHYYWRWLKNQSFLFLIFVALMTIARLSFAFYFGDATILKVHSEELRKALFLGFRYDLMPLAFVNALPFIIINIAFFIPGKFTIKTVRFLVVSLLFTGYLLIGWLYVFDYGFYSYFQDHLNILVFGFFEDDTQALIITIWKNYNVPLWGIVLFLLHFALFKLVKFLFSPFDFDLKARPFNFRIPLGFLTGLTLIAFMARGNFTRLPLSIEDSHISSNEFINEIALNGALSLNRAVKIRKTFGKDQFDYLKKYGFNDWKEAYHQFTGFPASTDDVIAALTVKTKSNPFLKENPPHVVLVVMESFGSYWNNSDAENFQIMGELKNHLPDGLLFKNFLPAENGTIGSIVSIATSEVIRPGARFLSESEYMSTKVGSAGQIPFQQSGYDTHFVYGGKLGWRDLGKYLSTQGYDHLWGADEIKEAMPELNNFSARDLGNEWGIFDEYLYSFIDEQLRTATKPQFFLVLTTSNHPPFEYPSSYMPKKMDFTNDLLEKLTVDEDLAKKRFLGVQYANQKMGEFLTKVKTSKLNDNTVVAFTGDHSYWIAKNVGHDQEFKRYAVPFFIRLPEKYKPSNVDLTKFGSHEDIFPTLYNLTLSDQNYIKLGEDIISEKSDAINSSGIIANKDGAFHHDKYWKWASLEEQILVESSETPELLELKRKALGLIGLTDSYLKNEKSRKQTGAGSDRP